MICRRCCNLFVIWVLFMFILELFSPLPWVLKSTPVQSLPSMMWFVFSDNFLKMRTFVRSWTINYSIYIIINYNSFKHIPESPTEKGAAGRQLSSWTVIQLFRNSILKAPVVITWHVQAEKHSGLRGSLHVYSFSYSRVGPCRCHRR